MSEAGIFFMVCAVCYVVLILIIAVSSYITGDERRRIDREYEQAVERINKEHEQEMQRIKERRKRHRKYGRKRKMKKACEDEKEQC